MNEFDEEAERKRKKFKNYITAIIIGSLIGGAIFWIPEIQRRIKRSKPVSSTTTTIKLPKNSVLEGPFAYKVVKGEAHIVDCIDVEAAEINIPQTLGGYPVTVIEKEAFTRCFFANKITIPEGVTTLESSCFHCFPGLKEIYLPDSIQTIGEDAFSDCHALESVRLPKNLTNLASNAFSYNNLLKNVSISADNEVFGVMDKTVYNKTTKSLVLYLGRDPNVTIPKWVKHIGDYSFVNHKYIKSVTIGDAVETIGNHAFAFTELESLTLSDAVTSIGDQTFTYCKNLKKVTFGKNLKSIGFNAFSSCESLGEVTIPESVSEIGDYAFGFCKMLQKVTLPQNLQTISGGLFASCNNLRNISIPDGVTSIGDGAFHDCFALRDLVLPSGLISIGDEAFEYCGMIRKITLPPTLQSIGSQAFRECYFNDVFIPKSIKSIKKDSFDKVTKIIYEKDLEKSKSK